MLNIIRLPRKLLKMSSQSLPEETIFNQSFTSNDLGSSFKTVSDENSQEMLTEPISTSELNVCSAALCPSRIPVKYAHSILNVKICEIGVAEIQFSVKKFFSV